MNNHTSQGHLPQDKVLADKALAEQVAKLPDEMTPDRDLWPGIERAINAKRQQKPADKHSNIFIPSAWAASMAMVMLMSWFTFSPETNEKTVPTLVKIPKQASPASAQLVNFMQQNFIQQKQILLASYGQPMVDRLPAAMQQELTQLAEARASIRKALLVDENNNDLLNLLDFTQQQELKLLQQLYHQYQVI
ncbi:MULTISPECIES: hypothetical protein [Colwellia]|uniref:Anti-sigma factor n=1 Tax=Colwellia marinimaniae TaxID=1513592 RepID=A0ABQ0MQG9_9GAMM|nr:MULTISPECIES: hypothetical protein [Colwellia]GAW94611.1 hypothetical protein MTCD1_00207 [Colwellia marinimaniae]